MKAKEILKEAGKILLISSLPSVGLAAAIFLVARRPAPLVFVIVYLVAALVFSVISALSYPLIRLIPFKAPKFLRGFLGGALLLLALSVSIALRWEGAVWETGGSINFEDDLGYDVPLTVREVITTVFSIIGKSVTRSQDHPLVGGLTFVALSLFTTTLTGHFMRQRKEDKVKALYPRKE